MALPYNLSVAAFYDRFRVQDVSFVQGFQQQRSMTGGGETRYADRAPALWKAEITTEPLINAEAEGIMALINSRAGGLKTVLLYNTKLPYPATDPTGAVLGAAAPVLGTITDRLHTAFSGLPAGYSLPLGTYFSVLFDTSRHYLGQIVEAKTANGSGAVTSTEIWPPLPASISAGAAVNLIKPPAKFRITPGTAYPAKEGGLHTVVKFSAEQTYSAN